MNSLYSVEIDEKSTNIDILSNSYIFLDGVNSLTYKDIVNKKFIVNEKKILTYGFLPDKALWIKFKLTNTTNKTLKKVIEYAHPITEKIFFYGDEHNKTAGIWHKKDSGINIHPRFDISIKPYESKVYYFKVYSKIATVVAKVVLWNEKDFLHHEYMHKIYLSIFFTAIIILFVYNLMLYIFTKDKVYFYYISYLLGVIIFQAHHVGIPQLYIYPQWIIPFVSKASMVYIGFLMYSMVMFTRVFLDTYNFPKIDKVLRYYIYTIPIATIISYDNLLINLKIIVFYVPLAVIVIFTAFYTYFKGVKQAKFYLLGWIFVMITMVVINLKTMGIFNATDDFIYLNEIAFILEALLFSIALAHKIKIINEEKNKVQLDLINYKQEEEIRLNELVNKKTKDLKLALSQKDILYKELNHRVKNNLNMIISLIKLQILKSKNSELKNDLTITKDRISSLSKLYEILNIYNINNFDDTKNYFQNIVYSISKNFSKSIDVKYNVKCSLDVDTLLYCGLIINELVTNSFKYAFEDSGNIGISLKIIEDRYLLEVNDDGIGFENINNDTLGLLIVKTLVENQLLGNIDIDKTVGTRISINWRKKD